VDTVAQPVGCKKDAVMAKKKREFPPEIKQETVALA
jgi:hypothetical protein